MTITSPTVEFEVTGGDQPCDELLELLADILLDLVAPADGAGGSDQFYDDNHSSPTEEASK